LEVLEETLCEFQGAVILVTHDRFMLDRVSTAVIGLSGSGPAQVFADYTQWEIWHDQMPKAGAKKNAAPRNVPAESAPAGARKKLTYGERLELQGIEKKIVRAEAQVKKIEAAMASDEAACDHLLLQKYCLELAALQKEVEQLYNRWHELEQRAGEEPEV
jgi:ABC transport system ATP-binding/permease protein